MELLQLMQHACRHILIKSRGSRFNPWNSEGAGDYWRLVENCPIWCFI